MGANKHATKLWFVYKRPPVMRRWRNISRLWLLSALLFKTPPMGSECAEWATGGWTDGLVGRQEGQCFDSGQIEQSAWFMILYLACDSQIQN
jgi:hypothetical protein